MKKVVAGFVGGVVAGVVVGVVAAAARKSQFAGGTRTQTAGEKATDVLAETVRSLTDAMARFVAPPDVTYENYYGDQANSLPVGARLGDTRAPSLAARNGQAVRGPVDEPDGDEWEDPTDLDKPLDALPEDLMQAARLEAWYPAPTVDAFPEPVPESEPLHERVAGYGADENPFEDIGGTVPQWPPA